MSIDLSQLPPPNVIEPIDFETILAARKARLLELTPEASRPAMAATLALESEPITIVLQENAYRELVLRQRINEASQALMLAYSTGTDLDQLAANYEVKRLVVSPGRPGGHSPRPSNLRKRCRPALPGPAGL